MFIILLFLSSGLFLGWSLGANDAANVWGTAVGTNMVRFRTAAILSSVFILVGAVASGSGAAHTLGKLGGIPTLGGAFTVAFAAAFAVFIMTRAALPVSTSQAIVGAIIGWNIFSKTEINIEALLKILGTWLFSPVLTAFFAFILYFLLRAFMKRVKIHLLYQDFLTRILLLLVGVFGSYSLGANNIANVMGVFVKSVEEANVWLPLSFGSLFQLSIAQQLFGLGGIAIGVGVFTYSKRVMLTVGSDIYRLNPVTAFIVVLASSLVLFLFASKGLQTWLLSHNLPAFPLVPVSSSQSIVGGVIGIGLARGGRNINFRILGRISSGWVLTPLIACAVALLSLFIVQNVFAQAVY